MSEGETGIMIVGIMNKSMNVQNTDRNFELVIAAFFMVIKSYY